MISIQAPISAPFGPLRTPFSCLANLSCIGMQVTSHVYMSADMLYIFAVSSSFVEL